MCFSQRPFHSHFKLAPMRSRSKRDRELADCKWHALSTSARSKSRIPSDPGRREGRKEGRKKEREREIKGKRNTSDTFYVRARLAHERNPLVLSVHFFSFFFLRSNRRERASRPSDVGGNVAAVGGELRRDGTRGRCKDIRPPGTMSAINAARCPFDVNQTAGEYAPLAHWPRLPFVALQCPLQPLQRG